MSTQHIPTGPRAMSKEHAQPCNMRPLLQGYHAVGLPANRPQVQAPPTVIARLAGAPSSVHENHPWYHAILKVEKVLHRPYRDTNKLDKMTGRCLVSGRDKNYILADAVRMVHKRKGITLQGKLWKAAPEIDQLQFLKSAVSKECCNRAGLHAPDTYNPGQDERQDAKMVMAAAFFIEDPPKTDSEREIAIQQEPGTLVQHLTGPPIPTVNFPTDSPGLTWPRPTAARIMPTPPETQSAFIFSGSHGKEDKNLKHQSAVTRLQRREKNPKKDLINTNSAQKSNARDTANPSKRYNLSFGNRIEQVLLKTDKWASAWLTGDFGNTDVAWESFEHCLAMPDIIEDGELFEDGVKTRPYVIPAKRGYEASKAANPRPTQPRDGQQPPIGRLSSAPWTYETINLSKRLKLDDAAKLRGEYRAIGHGWKLDVLRYPDMSISPQVATHNRYPPKLSTQRELDRKAYRARTPTTFAPYIKKEQRKKAPGTRNLAVAPAQLRNDSTLTRGQGSRSSCGSAFSTEQSAGVWREYNPSTAQTSENDSVTNPVPQPSEPAPNRAHKTFDHSSSNNENAYDNADELDSEGPSAARQLNCDLANAQQAQHIGAPPAQVSLASQPVPETSQSNNYQDTDTDSETTAYPFPNSFDHKPSPTKIRIRLPSNLIPPPLNFNTDSFRPRSHPPFMASSSSPDVTWVRYTARSRRIDDKNGNTDGASAHNRELLLKKIADDVMDFVESADED